MTIINRVLPVFFLFILGYILKRSRFIDASAAAQLKKLVLGLALPALLFRAFARLEPGREELQLAVLMFVLCGLLLTGASLLARLVGKRNDIRVFMMGGFEAGMLGYALFLSVYGDAALPVFASVDLGQVLFVFFVLMPALAGRNSSRQSRNIAAAGKAAVRNAAASPVVWAIIGGLVTGTIGRNLNTDLAFLEPAAKFLEILGNLTVPLIALAIGYELSFHKGIIRQSLLFILIRKTVLLGAALLLTQFFPRDNPLSVVAFVTMLLLPPPFVVTLAAKDEEQTMVSGILSLSTVVSIAAFAIVVLLIG